MAVHAPRKPNKARRKRKSSGPSVTESTAVGSDAPTPRPDALAHALYDQLSTRPLVDIVRVYRELQHRFAFEPDDEPQRWCVDALTTCKAERGSVSANQYQRFWDALPDRSLWPSQSVIRSTFGSWTSARATIEPVGEFRAMTGSRQRSSMTAEGLLDTIRVWLDELGLEGRCHVLRRDAFLSWCRSRLSDPAYGHLEMPTSKRPIEKHLGGWIEALRLAGAHERAQKLMTARMRPFAGAPITRTLRTVQMMRMGGTPVDTTGAEDLLEWLPRAIAAAQRLAQMCWQPIPKRERTLVLDVDDLGPAGSPYLPATRSDEPGP